MARHRNTTLSSQDTAVYLLLQGSGHSLNDEEVHILDREGQQFEWVVKEGIYVKRK